jgi:hypothetical protein
MSRYSGFGGQDIDCSILFIIALFFLSCCARGYCGGAGYGGYSYGGVGYIGGCGSGCRY